MGRLPVDALVVAAHPDDEVLGAGIWLHRRRDADVRVLHITDGSPRDMQDARKLGFSTCKQYAEARQTELTEALALVGISHERCIGLAFPDREAYLHLPAIIARIRAIVELLRPQVVLSPAYEGGHPDHDAAAFAVAAVTGERCSLKHQEYPLYHASADGQMITGTFLSHASAPEEVIRPTEAELQLKQRMIDCFTTQKQILSRFTLGDERFRKAPAYDFTEAPHPGPLLYEIWGWGISAKHWRQEAIRCLAV